MKKKILKVAFFVLLLGAFTQCYEANEACIDFYASNYDLTADDACTDCCEFPDLIMQFSHRWDSLSFSTNDTLIDDFGNPFYFEQFSFFISEIELIDVLGESHYIEDSILLSTNGNAAYYKNDFQLVSLDQSSYTIGNVKIEEPINRVKFTIGVSLGNIDFSELEDDFVLKENNDMYLSGANFIPWRLELEKDTMTDVLSIIEAEISDNNVIEISKDLENTLGSDIRVPVNVEYRKILEGINMKGTDDAEIRQSIQNNFSKTFN